MQLLLLRVLWKKAARTLVSRPVALSGMAAAAGFALVQAFLWIVRHTGVSCFPCQPSVFWPVLAWVARLASTFLVSRHLCSCMLLGMAETCLDAACCYGKRQQKLWWAPCAPQENTDKAPTACRAATVPLCVHAHPAVVPGKEPPAAAAAAAGPAGKKPPVPTNCIEWSKPPVPSIAEAVAAAQKASARQAAQKRQRYEDGLSTLQQIADARRTYDNNGEPFEAPYKMRRRAVSNRSTFYPTMLMYLVVTIRSPLRRSTRCGGAR